MEMVFFMRKNKLILMSTVTSIAIYGCSSGGGGASSTDSSFSPTPLTWGYCDPSVYNEITPEMLSSLGSRLTCTKMIAPIDYSNPSKGTIEVALSKVAAVNPDDRKGAIFFNPGGPGGDGLSLAPTFGMLWSSASDTDPLGIKFRQISQDYDLIGFSPRGVGSSTQLVCQLPNSFYLPTKFPELGQGIQNQYNLYDNTELNASACQVNGLSPYINSDATVRDMDLARTLLGDAKLSYIGYSYGTWLGAWYAAVFPSHVDKMILDSSMNITNSIPIAFTSQPPALQYNLDNIVAPYAALNDATYALGSAESVQKIFPALNDTMKQITSGQLYSLLFSQASADRTVETLSAAKGVNQILADNPYATQDQIRALVDDYLFSPVSSVNTIIAAIAQGQVQSYFTRNQQVPQPVGADDSGSTNMAVKCNDTTSPTDFDFWANISDKLSAVAQVFGGDAISSNCTSTWGGPTVSRPSIDNIRQASPILMVQTQYDGATPLAGATATYNAIGTASMVYVTNSYNHGVFSTINNGCVDNASADYLLTGQLPSSQLLVCAGKGLLPNMELVANNTSINALKTGVGHRLSAAMESKAVNGKDVSTSDTFVDKSDAERLREKIRDSIFNADKHNF